MSIASVDADTSSTIWSALETALIDWLPLQRWYGAKDRPVDRVHLMRLSELPDPGDGPRGVLAVARVHSRGASGRPGATTTEDYQVPVGIRRQLPECPRPALITRVSGQTLYDATADPELMSLVLSLIGHDADAGQVAFRHERSWSSLDVREGMPARLNNAEQSNTSVVFGERYILKLFRRLTPGVNPDVALHRALQWAGCTHVARMIGTIETRMADQPITLGMLQCYAATAQDGWQLASERAHAAAAGRTAAGFEAEARALGAAVAEVHRDLAHQLPTESWDGARLAELAADMRASLCAALRVVPPLAGYRKRLVAAFDEVATLPEEVPAQHVHGDLHLGQTLWTPTRWLILDFEGEPAAPQQRTARHSVLRDVAGMLRSFDYAAQQARDDVPGADPVPRGRVDRWAQRCRAAFLSGYTQAADIDLSAVGPLLRAYELHKAVYETVYEARNRPDWLSVPLAALDRLLEPVPMP